MMNEQQIYAHRIAERDLEYRQRCMELDLAGSGIPPVGLEPKAQSYGAQEFVDALVGVDVSAVLETVALVHRQGYAVVPLLSAAEVNRTRDAMAPLFEDSRRMFGSVDSVLGSNQTIHVQNVLAKTDALDAIASNATLRAIVAGILGYDFIFNAGAVAMSPDPGCSSQGLHRDDGFFALLPRPHMPLVVTAAIALDDFDQENGGTQLVPGSCLWDASRHPQPEDIEYCDMKAGRMLVWDGALFHGGGANQTQDRPRRTLTFNYVRGWLRTQFNQYLSIPRRRVMSMPTVLQKDLGYRRSALGLGSCDLQDPLNYLQRLDQAGGDGAQHQLGRESAPLDD
jgi:ectoine hydroxylase-related dioxygenase (phytanoyl-CoA dioxygenase family)